jgi:hypothetical protein
LTWCDVVFLFGRCLILLFVASYSVLSNNFFSFLSNWKKNDCFLEPLHTFSPTGLLVKLLLRQDCILLLLSHLWWNYCQTMQIWKIFT